MDPTLKRISVNGTNSLAINNAQQVMAWGQGKFGLLGNGQSQGLYTFPNIIEFQKLSNDHQAVHISIGHYHAAAVFNDALTKTQFESLDQWKENLRTIEEALIFSSDEEIL